MKKILFSALAIAVALTSCNNKSTQGTSEVGEVQAVVSNDLAYVQVETVLAKCDLYVQEGAPLREKTEKAQKAWTQKEQSLQYEAAQLQEKYQKGLMTTIDAQTKQQQIEQKIRNYQSTAQKEAQTLEEENYVFTNRAQDLLQRAVKLINAEKRYKMIVNANALIDADSTLDITQVVLESVNKIYATEKKSDKKQESKK